MKFLVALVTVALIERSVVAQNGGSQSMGNTSAMAKNQGTGTGNSQWSGTNAGGPSLILQSVGSGKGQSADASQNNGAGVANSTGDYSLSNGMSQQQGIAGGSGNGLLGASGDLNGNGTVAATGQGINNNDASQAGQGFAQNVVTGTGSPTSGSAMGTSTGTNNAAGAGAGQGMGQASLLGPKVSGSGNTFGNGFGTASGGSSNNGAGTSSSSGPGVLANPAFPSSGSPSLAMQIPQSSYGGQTAFGNTNGKSSDAVTGVGQAGATFNGAVSPGTENLSANSTGGTTQTGNSAGQYSAMGANTFGRR